MLAHISEQDQVCPGCKGWLDEVMDPSADGKYRARVFRCHRCAAIERKSSEFADARSAAGIRIVAERID